MQVLRIEQRGSNIVAYPEFANISHRGFFEHAPTEHLYYGDSVLAIVKDAVINNGQRVDMVCVDRNEELSESEATDIMQTMARVRQ